MKTFKVSLIITTYNSPEYLKLSLKSVLSQTILPDEILIADDGSRESVVKEIDAFVKDFPIPVIHVWQPDNGFRLSTIRNKAIEKASGEYIIQIDGDIILHTDFIKDHIANARRGYYVGGSRCFIKKDYPLSLLSNPNPSFDTLSGNLESRYKSLRIPFLSKLLRSILHRNKITIRGCNMAYWREDAMRINGYNEDFVSWGCEDCEFVIRLSNVGIKKTWLKFSGIAYHLYHNHASGNNYSANNDLMLTALNENKTWINNGIIKTINSDA